jgi:hypothetical protein
MFAHGEEPSQAVLHAFELEHTLLPLPGGITHSTYISGHRVLKRIDNREEAQWAARLLSDPLLQSDQFRIPLPVEPVGRPGQFVVESWTCSNFVAGTSDSPKTLRQWAEILKAARAFHAILKQAVPSKPAFLDVQRHRWDVAAMVAFGELDCPDLPLDAVRMLGRLREVEKDIDRLTDEQEEEAELFKVPQLVHSDLAGNMLLTRDKPPAIIDFSPMWRPAAWAEAIIISDGLVEYGADHHLVELGGISRARLEMLVKAMVFRVISDWLGEEDSMAGMQPKWARAIELVRTVASNRGSN